VDDHNLLFRTGNNNIYASGAKCSSAYSLSLYQSATGKGQGSIQANPMFVDASRVNFRLQSTSPAIDAGINIDTTVDIEGNPRPQGGGYDIGAYEYTNGKIFPPSSHIQTPKGEHVSLLLIADTYVDSASERSNYGSTSHLSIDGSPSNKISYLKFDLRSLSGQTILSAVLRLRVSSKPYSDSTSTQYLKEVSNTSWIETGVTFSNRPVLSTTLGNITVGSGSLGQWQEVDITSFVQSKAGQVVSLGIDAPASSPDGVDFNSRETASTSPHLRITKIEPSPTHLLVPNEVGERGRKRAR
jgi:hypothetical protein